VNKDYQKRFHNKGFEVVWLGLDGMLALLGSVCARGGNITDMLIL
jgi:hypothetical protein